jgi:hypothetical protein
VLLGGGRYQLAAGAPGPITASLRARGRELLPGGGYVRVVLRSGAVSSGFTTFLKK